MTNNSKPDSIANLFKHMNPDAELFSKEMDDLFSSFGKVMIISHALDNDVFDFLKSSKSSIEVAQHFLWNETLTDFYCGSLESFGFLLSNYEENVKKYICSQIAIKYLTNDSDFSQVYNLKNKLNKLPGWINLDKVMRDGPLTFPDEELMSRGWIVGIAQNSMDGQITKLIKTVERYINLTSVTKFLDLGGGHGLYAIAISSMFPNIKSTVLDKPGIIEVAEEYIEKYQAKNHVCTVKGDYRECELPKNNDIILSSFSPCGTNLHLIKKISDSLVIGGLFVIRRHSESLGTNPFRNLEWNLVRPESSKNITKRFGLDVIPNISEYITKLEESGLRLITHEPFDEVSDIIITKKIKIEETG